MTIELFKKKLMKNCGLLSENIIQSQKTVFKVTDSIDTFSPWRIKQLKMACQRWVQMKIKFCIYWIWSNVDGPIGWKWTVLSQTERSFGRNMLQYDSGQGFKVDGHSIKSGSYIICIYWTVQFHPFGSSTFMRWDRPDLWLQIVQSFSFGPSTFGFQDRPLSQTIHFKSFGPSTLDLTPF